MPRVHPARAGSSPPSPAPAEGYAPANRPLIKALTRHVDALAGNGMPREKAAGWVFASVVAAWAEDHGLTPPRLRSQPADGLADPRARLISSYAQLGVHPATRCILEPAYHPLTGNPDQAALGDLLDWWARLAPPLSDPAPPAGPSSITGWLVGDLLQALCGDRADGAALNQTPWFVADFLCERTVVPAYRDFPRARAIRVIDPAAGTGHLLVWAALGLHRAYLGGAAGRRPATAMASVRRLVQGVCGVELDPLTAAVARLRLTALYGCMLGDGRPIPLAKIPKWVVPKIAVGNALLAGRGDPNPPGTILDDTDGYPGILAPGTYHAVIANPPYKAIADPVVRAAVRAAYPGLCHGRFTAAVPFMGLLFDLAIRAEHDDAPAGHIATPADLHQRVADR